MPEALSFSDLLVTRWVRLVELLYAAERWVELATDPEITSPDYPARPH